jgi:SAM-dependent methyltransferase
MFTMQSLARALVPNWLLAFRLNLKLRKIRHEYSELSLAETFSRIYANKGWGGEWCSGAGSDPEVNRAYLEFVRRFMHEHGIRTVVDLGCGDFRMGRSIAETDVRYSGVDIVQDLIARNQREFAEENVEFACLDIVHDDLPAGDLCLIRQVFQHLSNAEIREAISHCRDYPYILVTEHLPAGNFVPNLDKPHGPDIRLYLHSGVVLDASPFEIECEKVLELPFERDGILATFLIRNGSVNPKFVGNS